MYKLIGSKKSRAFRVLWALEEIGLEYEHISAAARSDEVRVYNASGKVPVLLVDDHVLTDSVAIIQFLADKHGQITFPAGSIERGQQDGHMQFACDEMDSTLWTAFRNSFIFPEELRAPAFKDALKWDYARSMKNLAGRLGDKTYLMGDTFTVADIVATHCGTWARGSGFDCAEQSVSDYFDRVVTRPAYIRAQAL